jgi:hypothetical protein
MWTLIVDVSTVDPQPGGISLVSRTTSADLQPFVSITITPFLSQRGPLRHRPAYEERLQNRLARSGACCRDLLWVYIIRR